MRTHALLASRSRARPGSRRLVAAALAVSPKRKNLLSGRALAQLAQLSEVFDLREVAGVVRLAKVSPDLIGSAAAHRQEREGYNMTCGRMATWRLHLEYLFI